MLAFGHGLTAAESQVLDTLQRGGRELAESQAANCNGINCLDYTAPLGSVVYRKGRGSCGRMEELGWYSGLQVNA